MTAMLTYLENPSDPLANVSLARVYKEEKQWAGAVSFFLRAAEYSEDAEFQYEALLHVADCFRLLVSRLDTVKTALYHCINLLPKRPEAYWLLSRLFECNKQYHDGLAWANMGLLVCNFSLPTIKEVGYSGKYNLIFEKSVCLDWCDKPQEATALSLGLVNMNMDTLHHEAVVRNLKLMIDRIS